MGIQANFTGDGNSAAASVLRGNYAFSAYGTFGGGTIKLQFSPDGGTTYVDVPLATKNAAGMILDLNLPAGLYRFNVAGSTTPNLNGQLVNANTDA